jgi:ribonucleoside-diphosphate reductase alpha chain
MGIAGATSVAGAVVATGTNAALLRSEGGLAMTNRQTRLKIAEAKLKGYEGDPCGSCGAFTLVRNGTCLKCMSCGGTSGCS